MTKTCAKKKTLKGCGGGKIAKQLEGKKREKEINPWYVSEMPGNECVLTTHFGYPRGERGGPGT